jgi:RNA 2',3'-cyclic 3'-phosphodiesterase
LRQLDRPERAGLRWTAEDQWHVTLRFFGSVDPAHLETLEQSLGLVASRSAAATAVSGPRPGALSQHVWMLPVAGLSTLADAFGPADRPFRGHITLARSKRRDSFSGLPAPELVETWPVEEFCLVKSDLLPTGARYQVLNRWRLQSR